MSETSKDGVKCPYCGNLHTPEDTDFGIYETDENRHTMDCDVCLKEFYWTAKLKFSWESLTQEENDYL